MSFPRFSKISKRILIANDLLWLFTVYNIQCTVAFLFALSFGKLL